MTGPAVRLLRAQLRPHRRALTLIGALSLALAVPTGASGLVVARALDRGFLVEAPLVGLAWLGLFAALGIAAVALNRALFPLLAATVEPLRDQLVTLVVSAGLDRAVAAADAAPGADAVRATDEVEGIRATVGAILRNLHMTVAGVLGAVLGLLLLEPVVALITLPCLLVGLGLYGPLIAVSVRRYRRAVLAEEQLAERAAEVFAAQRDIASCAAGEAVASDVRRQADAVAAGWIALGRLGGLRLAVTVLAVETPVLLVVGLGPGLISAGRLTWGDAVGAVLYLTSAIGPAVRFVVHGAADWVVGVLGAATRLAEVLPATDPPPARPEAEAAPSPRVEAQAGVADPQPGLADPQAGVADRPAVRLRGLTFRYSPDAAPVLRDVSLDVPYGEHLAVIGPSGSGKSTLVALLGGVRQPDAGTVTLGETALAELPPARRHRDVALVPQQAYVFAGTVRENLAYLAPDLPDAALRAAADEFGLGDVLRRLGGLDGLVPAGGAGLSAGERQLVTLARTYVAPARLVLLDEATCHLDPAAERRAELLFRERPGTLVVVAHRIASAWRADRILLVDGGAAVAGSHADLLAGSARYRELVRHWRAEPGDPPAASGPVDPEAVDPESAAPEPVTPESAAFPAGQR
ncbi:ABC transporter ATP-binding protein [Micromonospora okii]|uniref:ABC transporter ATP-binding protein n=1 Tax=Micromonospora okii TaxID=1182970 RepID=UPI001E3C2081|nr:ABC transporter ATP-binding protein [Micromonospora okii]